MKIHIYTNNGYDTVAIVNDEDQVISHWDASDMSQNLNTVFECALYTTDVTTWHDQGLEINLSDFEEGNELLLVIHEDGEWEIKDRELLISRLEFHLREGHPIVKCLNT